MGLAHTMHSKAIRGLINILCCLSAMLLLTKFSENVNSRYRCYLIDIAIIVDDRFDCCYYRRNVRAVPPDVKNVNITQVHINSTLRSYPHGNRCGQVVPSGARFKPRRRMASLRVTCTSTHNYSVCGEGMHIVYVAVMPTFYTCEKVELRIAFNMSQGHYFYFAYERIFHLVPYHVTNVNVTQVHQSYFWLLFTNGNLCDTSIACTIIGRRAPSRVPCKLIYHCMVGHIGLYIHIVAVMSVFDILDEYDRWNLDTKGHIYLIHNDSSMYIEFSEGTSFEYIDADE